MPALTAGGFISGEDGDHMATIKQVKDKLVQSMLLKIVQNRPNGVEILTTFYYKQGLCAGLQMAIDIVEHEGKEEDDGDS